MEHLEGLNEPCSELYPLTFARRPMVKTGPKHDRRVGITSRFRKRRSRLYRFCTNSLHISSGFPVIVEDLVVLTEIAFLRMRPAAVGLAAPRMDRGSEEATPILEASFICRRARWREMNNVSSMLSEKKEGGYKTRLVYCGPCTRCRK